MRSACFFRRIILPALFLVFTLVSSQSTLSAEPLIYYTLTESKAGDQSLQILLPNTIYQLLHQIQLVLHIVYLH